MLQDWESETESSKPLSLRRRSKHRRRFSQVPPGKPESSSETESLKPLSQLSPLVPGREAEKRKKKARCRSDRPRRPQLLPPSPPAPPDSTVRVRAGSMTEDPPSAGSGSDDRRLRLSGSPTLWLCRGLAFFERRYGLADDSIKRRYSLATFFEAHLKKLQRESWLETWSEERRHRRRRQRALRRRPVPATANEQGE